MMVTVMAVMVVTVSIMAAVTMVAVVVVVGVFKTMMMSKHTLVTPQLSPYHQWQSPRITVDAFTITHIYLQRNRFDAGSACQANPHDQLREPVEDDRSFHQRCIAPKLLDTN